MTIADKMQVEILSPEKSLLNTSAVSLVIPGRLGYMTILPGHTTMISELGVGTMHVHGSSSGKEEAYFIAGGFAEVQGDRVRVLVDVIERPTEIDVERARKAEARARNRLSGQSKESDLIDIDYARAQGALLRAQARMAAAGHLG